MSVFEPIDAGTKRGCAAALLVGAPVGFVLMLIDALGDCENCRHSLLLNVVLPTFLVGLVVFVAVRGALNRRGR